MKKLLLLGMVMLMSVQLYAQRSLSGTIIDESNEEALPFASVSIFDASEKLVTGGASNEKGVFIFQDLEKGNYVVKITCIGYQPTQKNILLGELNEHYDLGKIELIADTKMLDGVTVAGQRAISSENLEQKSFNMDDLLAQSGGSVLDAMKNMPGVAIDADGKLFLRGSDKVIVLINGKQSALTGFGQQKGLDNLPASNIEKIEVIHNPSSKYDAAGMAGIVNIIYKESKEKGFNGSVGLTYGLGALTQRKSDLPTDLGSYQFTPKYIPSLDLNYRSKKVNWFLQSEVLSQEKLPNNEFTTRHYEDGRVTRSQVPENRQQIHYIVKGGANIDLDDKNRLTVSGVYDWENHQDTAQVAYLNKGGERYRYTNWMEDEITGFMNFGLNWEHQFDQPGHELTVDGQYTKGWEDETYYINDSSAVRQGRDVTNILAIEHTIATQVDYTKPLASGRLELGLKGQWRWLPVEYTVDRGHESVIYPDLGEWSDWGENIYATYMNWVMEKTKFSMEMGLRAEYTEVFYKIDPANKYYDEDDAYDYFRIFPNIRMSYNLGNDQKFSAFLNSRVDRPGEQELRVFPKSDDQELLKMGNPYLRPQFTTAVELSYRKGWSSGSLVLATFHKWIEDPFMRVYTEDTENEKYDVMFKSYANTGSATNTGFEWGVEQKVGSFWKMNANMNIYRNHIHAFTGMLRFPYEHEFTVEDRVDLTWDMKIGNTFILPRNFTFQLSGLYVAPKNIAQGRMLSRSSVDFGLSKKVMEGKGEWTLSMTDVFNQYGIRQEIYSDGFTVNYENFYETQVVRLGFKYKF
ncbi:TonB-dependent receptor domain-containing protein [Persicobacter psychrovividus]|uniref:TonB-dependent receptor n=1 Tax=Persicobacter psychrovividus TaxID=387638 RepID=A0ABN6LAR4_9BACT|nr:TonB-dependent receptor [Persicobacter psychrovividus]